MTKKTFKKCGHKEIAPEERERIRSEIAERKRAREHHRPTDHAVAVETAQSNVRNLPNTDMANLGACYLELVEFLNDNVGAGLKRRSLTDVFKEWRDKINKMNTIIKKIDHS